MVPLREKDVERWCTSVDPDSVSPPSPSPKGKGRYSTSLLLKACVCVKLSPVLKKKEAVAWWLYTVASSIVAIEQKKWCTIHTLCCRLFRPQWKSRTATERKKKGGGGGRVHIHLSYIVAAEQKKWHTIHVELPIFLTSVKNYLIQRKIIISAHIHF